jgi:hypothetical protein
MSSQLRAEGTIARWTNAFASISWCESVTWLEHAASNPARVRILLAWPRWRLACWSTRPRRSLSPAAPARSLKLRHPCEDRSHRDRVPAERTRDSSQGTSDASPTERASNGGKSESKTEAESEGKRAADHPMASQRAWHALVQAPVLELGVGPLPHSARGIGLSLGLEYTHWQLQLKGISWQRQNVPAPGGLDTGRTLIELARLSGAAASSAVPGSVFRHASRRGWNGCLRVALDGTLFKARNTRLG